MLFGLGPWEIALIVVVIILLFGVGRISRLGGEIGSAIREFRKGLSPKQDEEENKK